MPWRYDARDMATRVDLCPVFVDGPEWPEGDPPLPWDDDEDGCE